jgi:hypothetical protein
MDAVRAGAALGNRAAHDVSGAPLGEPPKSMVGLNWKYFNGVAAHMNFKQFIAFALSCARRALPMWETCFPADSRVLAAISMLEGWRRGDQPTDEAFLEAANHVLSAKTGAGQVAFPAAGVRNQRAETAAAAASVVYTSLLVAHQVSSSAAPHDDIASGIHQLSRVLVSAGRVSGQTDSVEFDWIYSALHEQILGSD